MSSQPQKNLNKPKNYFYKFIIGWLCFGFIFISFFSITAFPIVAVKQAKAMGLKLNIPPILPAGPGFPVTTTGDAPAAISSIWEAIWGFIETAGKIVFKSGLDYFLQRIAYDSATYLATGSKGQQPLFWEKGVGGYLNEIGNEAIALGLDEAAKGTFGVSLCEPRDASIKLNLILSAKQTFAPARPVCTFSEMAKNNLIDFTVNGQKVNLSNIKQEDWYKFANYFRPYANDLGAQMTLTSNIKEQSAATKELGKLIRSLEPEIKSLTTPIGKLGDDLIKTPAIANSLAFTKSIGDAISLGATTLTGDTLADAVNTFTNTFASKFLERLQKGLLTGKGGQTGGGPGDAGFVGSSYGTRAAEATYAEFIIPKFSGSGALDVLATISSCPSGKQGQLYNNCIIDGNLATAIDQKLTVREAISKGYLDPNKPFGFLLNGSEPDYLGGYSYRNLVFMRKYRIIPVTWELAALYIRDIATEKKVYSLAGVMGTEADNFNAFNSTSSPFYHLVDPNWVLEIPQYECRVEGPGPQVLYREKTEYEMPDGIGGTETIEQDILSRASYCADERTCIVENANGSCQQFGYCTKERDTWNFLGQACQSQFATCENFVKAGTNNKASYLVSTLEGCDASQAGCRWFSIYKNSNNNWAEDIWNQSTNSPGSDGIITFGDVYNRSDLGNISYTRYLNSQVEKCSSGDDGCTKFLSLSSVSAPGGYEASTQGIYQYVQDNQATYTDSGYLDSYGEWGLVTEKFLQVPPTYLNCPADINDPNRDSRCNDYAQVCTPEEVGCSLYVPVNGDPPIPAVLTNNDYCSDECVGYDQYLEVPTYFEKLINPSIIGQQVNVIPTSADTCRLSDVGCEEFTNLDEVAQGGEGIENFSYIRECILPNDPAAKVFYTWEGSDTTGYQLKTWRLEADGGAGPTGTTCDPVADPLNCRIFIDSGGNSYNIDIATVTFATDDCHPYRRSLDNTVLYGIKSLSRSCTAAAVGCKEYRGNQGNVINIIVNDDFESGTSEGWMNGVNSSVSVYVGGHSINTQAVIVSKKVSGLITEGKNYTISFWARSSAPSASLRFEIQQYTPHNITRSNSIFSLVKPATAQVAEFESLQPLDGSQRYFDAVTLTDEWQYYRLGPLTFDRAVGAYEFLETDGANVYLDNVILREITDSYYLIDDSWETPAVCDQPYVGAQIGCQAYKTTNKDIVNLLGFTALCSDSKVGCTALIDTKNNPSPFVQTYNDSNNGFSDPLGLDDVVVPNDSLVFLVDSKDAQCKSKFQGCKLAGEAIVDRQSDSGEEVLAFNERYIIDNPEKYEQILCGVGGLYCQQYKNERTGATSYFIDPDNRACEYTLLPGQTEANWYRTGTSVLCDIPTPEPYPLQPLPATDVNYDGWVGMCASEQAGCSQYYDPESTATTTLRSYFYLEQSVNTGGCNGIVDRQQGCRLFNKIDGSPQAFTAGAYSTTTPDGSTPISSSVPAENEANIILKVQKDRTCQEWLYCRTLIEAYDNENNRDDKCLDIGVCDSLNDRGQCNNNPVLRDTEIVGQQIAGGTGYNPALYSVEDLRLMSGYTKAGMSWSGFTTVGDGTTPGYLPYNMMMQVGNYGNMLYNAGFEETQAPVNGSPFPGWIANKTNPNISWCNAGMTCNTSVSASSFSGVNAAHLSISGGTAANYASLYLRQNLSLTPGEYILSGYIKWDSVQNRNNTWDGANITILENGTEINEGTIIAQFGAKYDYSNGWVPFAIRFTSATGNFDINLKLGTLQDGDVYFDGLSILPALQATQALDEYLLEQRCRMYPKADSPECNYLDGNKSYVGWPGFCVEPDPRNPSYCVNWWPVDIINGSVGQTGEEPLAYDEKVPLYYCLEAKGNSELGSGFTGVCTTGANIGSYCNGVVNNNPACGPGTCSHDTYTNTGSLSNSYKVQSHLRFRNEMYTDNLPNGCQMNPQGSDNISACSVWSAIAGADSCSRGVKSNINCYRSGVNENLTCAYNEVGTGPASNLTACQSLTCDTNNNADGDFYTYTDTGNANNGGGNTYCGVGGSITAVDNQITLNEVEGIYVETLQTSMDAPVRNTYLEKHIANNDVYYTLPGRWNSTTNTPASCSAPGRGESDWIIYIKFSPFGGNVNNKRISQIYFYTCRGPHANVNGNEVDLDEISGERVNLYYYLREPCTKLVKVSEVLANGETSVYPYWTRVDPYTGYIIPRLNYTYNTENYGSKDSPRGWNIFGSIYQSGLVNYGQNENNPTTWDSRPTTETGNQPLYVEAYNPLGITSLNPGPNIRAGAPYSCVGNCSGSLCVGGTRNGNPCNTDQDARDCYTGDGGTNVGICIGSYQTPITPPNATGNNAIASLRQIFARSLGIYEWQNQSGWRYVQVGGDWNDTGSTTLRALPVIGNVLINDSNVFPVTLQNGGSIKLSFTTQIDNDRLPLRSYSINWGDGSSNVIQGYFNERPSPGDPHVLYHSYNSTDLGSHPITIMVMDNWGAGVPNQWITYTLTNPEVIVTPP